MTAEIKCHRVIKETAKAILCEVDGPDLDTVQVWVPKSVIDDNSEVYSLKSGQEPGTLVVQTWFAEKEGLA